MITFAISAAAILLFLALLSMILGPVCAMIWPQYVGSWYLAKELKKRNINTPVECVNDLSEICTHLFKSELKTNSGLVNFLGLARHLDIMLEDVDSYLLHGAEWSVAGQVLDKYGIKPRADVPTKTQLMNDESEQLFSQEILLFQNYNAATGRLKGHFRSDSVMLRRLDRIIETNTQIRQRTMPGHLASSVDCQTLADINVELRKLYNDTVLVNTERIRQAFGSADRRFSPTFDEAHVPMMGWDAHMERLRSMSRPE